MNFAALWKYFSVVQVVLGALEMGFAQIEAGQPVTSPGEKTYIGGRHVSVSITVTPIP